MGKARDYNDKYVIDMLNLEDPQEAVAYLECALDEYEKDNNTEAFILALRRVVEAKGGISELARKSGLNRQNLHRILSNKANPRFNTLSIILHSLGFKLSLKAS